MKACYWLFLLDHELVISSKEPIDKQWCVKGEVVWIQDQPENMVLCYVDKMHMNTYHLHVSSRSLKCPRRFQRGPLKVKIVYISATHKCYNLYVILSCLWTHLHIEESILTYSVWRQLLTTVKLTQAR